jgi:hypothetical protein
MFGTERCGAPRAGAAPIEGVQAETGQTDTDESETTRDDTKAGEGTEVTERVEERGEPEIPPGESKENDGRRDDGQERGRCRRLDGATPAVAARSTDTGVEGPDRVAAVLRREAVAARAGDRIRGWGDGKSGGRRERGRGRRGPGRNCRGA